MNKDRQELRRETGRGKSENVQQIGEEEGSKSGERVEGVRHLERSWRELWGG